MEIMTITHKNKSRTLPHFDYYVKIFSGFNTFIVHTMVTIDVKHCLLHIRASNDHV